MISACINKPAITVAMYFPTMSNDWTMSSIAATLAAIKLQMPIGETLEAKNNKHCKSEKLGLNWLNLDYHRSAV